MKTLELIQEFLRENEYWRLEIYGSSICLLNTDNGTEFWADGHGYESMFIDILKRTKSLNLQPKSCH